MLRSSLFAESMLSLNSVMDEIYADRLTVDHLSCLQDVTKALRDDQFRCENIIMKQKLESYLLSPLLTVIPSMANVNDSYFNFLDMFVGQHVLIKIKLTITYVWGNVQ